MTSNHEYRTASTTIFHHLVVFAHTRTVCITELFSIFARFFYFFCFFAHIHFSLVTMVKISSIYENTLIKQYNHDGDSNYGPKIIWNFAFYLRFYWLSLCIVNIYSGKCIKWTTSQCERTHGTYTGVDVLKGEKILVKNQAKQLNSINVQAKYTIQANQFHSMWVTNKK